MAIEQPTGKNAEETEEKKPVQRKAVGKKAETYAVAVPLLNIRERASIASEIVDTVAEGEILSVVSRTPQGFGKLADGSGYVLLEYVAPVKDDE